MKKFISALVCLALMVCGSAFASGVDLSTMSEEELLALQAELDEALAERPDYSTYTDEELAREAIEVLKEHWRERLAGLEMWGRQTNGYFAIRSVRVVRFADVSSPEWSYEQANITEEQRAFIEESCRNYFSGMEAVVEFTLLTDFYCAAPYYWEDRTGNNTVTFYTDGTVNVGYSPILGFAGIYYDYTSVYNIIESITDFGSKFNEEYDLAD